jgi:MFS family permease
VLSTIVLLMVSVKGKTVKPMKWAGLWWRADFRQLWGASTAWAAGAEVAELALPALAILGLGASPAQAGLLVAAPWLAFVVIGLPAGALVDRLPRKMVMIIADLGRFAALASVPAAFVIDRLSLSWLYAVAAVAGVLGVFSQVGFRSFLPALVVRDDLLEGNAKLTLGEGAAKVIGPSLTGIFIQLAGASAALMASAGFSLCSAFLVSRLPQERPAHPVVTMASVLGEAREGLAFVLGQSTLRRIVAVNTLGNLGTGIVEGIALVFAFRHLRLDAATVGLAMAVGSAGFVVSAIASNRITGILGAGPTLAFSCLVYAGGPFALFLGPLGYPVAAVILWRLLYGVSIPPYDVNVATIRQVLTPDQLQGRAIAAINTIGWGALGLGPLLGGVLGERIGAHPTILIGGCACLLAVIPALVPRLLVPEELPRTPLLSPSS